MRSRSHRMLAAHHHRSRVGGTVGGQCTVAQQVGQVHGAVGVPHGLTVLQHMHSAVVHRLLWAAKIAFRVV